MTTQTKFFFRQKAIANEISIADMNAFENWVKSMNRYADIYPQL